MKQEKVLLQEDPKKIEEYKNQLRSGIVETANILNQIIKCGYPIKSPSEIPSDTDAVVLKLLMDQNAELKRSSSAWSISLDDRGLIVPSELKALRSAFNAWGRWSKKDLSAYLFFKDSFIINEPMFAKELEIIIDKNRIYADQPDEVKRWRFSTNVLECTLDFIKESNIDISADTIVATMLRRQLLSPWISWIGYPTNAYSINIDYIKTGRIERK